jgi:hypothetical protein
MNLLETYDSLLQDWRKVFAQERTFDRARRLTFGLLVCLRLHLTSRAICAVGRQFVDWSADYRLCSRSPWDPHRLFDPIFDRLPVLLPSPSAPVIAALDDTLCKKTGRRIPGIGMARDPMSPAFHVNLCYGLRFVQVSVLVSPAEAPGAARALPVRFDFAPPAVKPKKSAPPEMHEAYKKEKKQRALPLAGLAAMISVRQSLDVRAETAQRQLIMSGDGSYTNKAVLRGLPPRTTFIGRIRKDAKLHLPRPASDGAAGRPRLYGPDQWRRSMTGLIQDKLTCAAAPVVDAHPGADPPGRFHPRGENPLLRGGPASRDSGESLWPGLLAQSRGRSASAAGRDQAARLSSSHRIQTAVPPACFSHLYRCESRSAVIGSVLHPALGD